MRDTHPFIRLRYQMGIMDIIIEQVNRCVIVSAIAHKAISTLLPSIRNLVVSLELETHRQ